jgi:hypothetical protein
MNIWDNKIETKSGATFSLHYRGLKNKTYSGFLRNIEWPRNCSISIPKTKGMAAFQAIVDEVIDNEEKFNSANTLGRPRYYDILANGVAGLPTENKVFKLRESNPDFHTYKNSKRMWYYKSIGGNFNMKSIKINHMRLIDSVSFKELFPFIKNEEVKEVLEALRRQKFEFEGEFINFCDQLIDATEDTLIQNRPSNVSFLSSSSLLLVSFSKLRSIEHCKLLFDYSDVLRFSPFRSLPRIEVRLHVGDTLLDLVFAFLADLDEQVLQRVVYLRLSESVVIHDPFVFSSAVGKSKSSNENIKRSNVSELCIRTG